MQHHSSPFDNRLLAALGPADWLRLQPHVEPVVLVRNQTIYESGETLSHAYFPTTLLASLMHVTVDGDSTESAVVGNDGCGQGHIVIMRARTGANAPLPLVRCQIFIGGDFAGCDAVLAGVNDPGAAGQAEPLIRGVAELGGNVGFQHIGLHRLGYPGVDDLHQARDINRKHQIGGRTVALGQQPLGQTFVDERHIHRNAGFGRKRVKQRLDQFWLTMRIDVYLVGNSGQRNRTKCERE